MLQIIMNPNIHFTMKEINVSDMDMDSDLDMENLDILNTDK